MLTSSSRHLFAQHEYQIKASLFSDLAASVDGCAGAALSLSRDLPRFLESISRECPAAAL